MKNLSNAEKEVLEVLCKMQKSITAKELQEVLIRLGIEWKIQTVSTLLARLESKGVIKSEIIKHIKYYKPQYNTFELAGIEAKRFIKEVFGGSLSSFFVALTDGAISDSKAIELEKWIREQQEEK
ncbi:MULTISPECIES: BlaI/MecI/CopY family transcriptional regulator [Butyrivibrio]|uniref:BlaI/MecI/CopY family transcriptional regulator n=1 Tax=Butyrivibrio TaxID=830 RepID=UPI0003F5816E|nr:MULTISPECIES: BlaI/MecI/CopY family transcriptional regulator [Butyrivibrio]